MFDFFLIMFLLEDLCYWSKYITNTINTKITQLQVTYKIRNQFDIGLKGINAKLSLEVERGHQVNGNAG